LLNFFEFNLYVPIKDKKINIYLIVILHVLLKFQTLSIFRKTITKKLLGENALISFSFWRHF